MSLPTRRLSDLEGVALRLCLSAYGISDTRSPHARARADSYARYLGTDVSLRLTLPSPSKRAEIARAKRIDPVSPWTPRERHAMRRCFAVAELALALDQVVERTPLGTAWVTASEIKALERRGETTTPQQNAMWETYHYTLFELVISWKQENLSNLRGSEPNSLGDRVPLDSTAAFHFARGRFSPLPDALPTYQTRGHEQEDTLTRLLDIVARGHAVRDSGEQPAFLHLDPHDWPQRDEVKDWAEVSRIVQRQIYPTLPQHKGVGESSRRTDAREIAYYLYRTPEPCVENVVVDAYVKQVAQHFRHASGK